MSTEAITDRDRRDLYDRLEQALGTESTDTLVELLPDQPARNLVTSEEFDRKMDALRNDVRDEILDVKATVLRVENDLSLRMPDLQTTLQTSMTRWIAGFGFANTIALVTAIVT